MSEPSKAPHEVERIESEVLPATMGVSVRRIVNTDKPIQLWVQTDGEFNVILTVDLTPIGALALAGQLQDIAGRQ